MVSAPVRSMPLDGMPWTACGVDVGHHGRSGWASEPRRAQVSPEGRPSPRKLVPTTVPAAHHHATARVAMIGAGQLARMTHQAAVDLDVELHVLAKRADEPAVLAGAPYRIGSHLDLADVLAGAGDGDVVTFDHELVPPPLLAHLEAAGHVLRPSAAALLFAQDKIAARERLSAAGYPVPAFATVASPAGVAEFAAEHGWPVVLKARAGGYDGRGVIFIAGPADLPADLEWATPSSPAWLVEAHVDLAVELAVLVARRPSGAAVSYPVVETTQLDGICIEVVTPARIAPEVAERAGVLARSIVEHIGSVGICAVELFVSAAGEILVNEVALRPHNSGHITIEANATSQFHQHLRAVLDWPLGATGLITPAAAMVNLIGVSSQSDPGRRLPLALANEGAQVHLYAKESRPGRKIGHVTAMAATADAALDVARAARASLLGS
jgi:5-(carboxyamino)imidazole ribonucleotide synthase